MNPHDLANAEMIDLLRASLEAQATSPVEPDEPEGPEALEPETAPEPPAS